MTSTKTAGLIAKKKFSSEPNIATVMIRYGDGENDGSIYSDRDGDRDDDDDDDDDGDCDGDGDGDGDVAGSEPLCAGAV